MNCFRSMQMLKSIKMILRLSDMPDEKKIILIRDEIDSMDGLKKAVSGVFCRWKPKRRDDR